MAKRQPCRRSIKTTTRTNNTMVKCSAHATWPSKASQTCVQANAGAATRAVLSLSLPIPNLAQLSQDGHSLFGYLPDARVMIPSGILDGGQVSQTLLTHFGNRSNGRRPDINDPVIEHLSDLISKC